MKCPSCGAHIEDTDKYCPYCGSVNEKFKKPEPPASPTQIEQQNQQKNNGNREKKEDNTDFWLYFWVGFSVVVFSIILTLSATCK